MSRATVTPDGIVAALGRDERFAGQKERCRVLRSLATWSWGLDRDDYTQLLDGACAAFPLDAFPWE